MDMGDVETFLSHLAGSRDCSANTQRIALNAIVYLYKRFMGVGIDDLQFTLARAQRCLPVVYSREENVAILSQLRGVPSYCRFVLRTSILAVIIFMFAPGKATKIALFRSY